MELCFEPLRSHHNRAGFDCGEASLNDYLHRYARQNEAGDIGRTFVAVELPGSPRIVGCYTLSSYSLESQSLAERGLPRYVIPAALVGRLARDVRLRRQGVGEALLRDALQRCLAVAEQMAVYAVVVDALDNRAKGFYLGFGFNELIDHPMKLYLPVKTIRQAVMKA
ncbi:MAG TPA: GNAT family N-acetyltransferase [Armatimonadota bacterium]|nr:GNAT family N-acetyltransferase [Armatimonadota bacterium]